MKSFFICRYCKKLNYGTLAYIKDGLMVHHPCCDCGETNAVFGAILGTEYTKEELIEKLNKDEEEIYRLIDVN